jgi:exopolysaccharide biosynthesis polyprenyl glycosylphosphotransferase
MTEPSKAFQPQRMPRVAARSDYPRRYRLSVPVLSGIVRFGDAAAMVAAAAVTNLLLILVPVPMTTPTGEFLVVNAIAIVVAVAMIRRFGNDRVTSLINPLNDLVVLLSAIAGGGATAALVLLLLRGDRAASPGFIPAHLLIEPLAWVLSACALLLTFRAGLAWRLQRHARAGHLLVKTAIVGANSLGHAFAETAASNDNLHVVGVFDDHALDVAADGTVTELVSFSHQYPVDAVVICLPPAETARVAVMQHSVTTIAADIFVATDVTCPVDIDENGLLLSSAGLVATGIRPVKDWRGLQKTVLDKVGSIVLLLLTFPLLCLIALLIRIDSRGPVLFRQPREGLHGTLFTMLKFRTMTVGGSDQAIQATRDDRRVTRVGYWLRRFSLDELPQLLNVLQGEMSLVGPRPHYAGTRIGERLFCDIVPGYHARHQMKPGLTGLAQVMGYRGETRTEQQLLDRVTHDLHYIDNWSMGLDLRILWRTLLREIVSKSGNAY